MFPLESKNDDYMVKNMSIKVISMDHTAQIFTTGSSNTVWCVLKSYVDYFPRTRKC